MDRLHYKEMLENLDALERESALRGKNIYLFGHCNATEQAVDLLLERGYAVSGILDNNDSKYGLVYRNATVMPPQCVLAAEFSGTIVCIAVRAYASMVKQLRQIGYTGTIVKLVEYDSFAEYSLSEKTIVEKRERLDRGLSLLKSLKEKYPDCFRVYCPFPALGDVFLAMSYLPHFLSVRCAEKCVVCVTGDACGQVVSLFDFAPVEVYPQRELDSLIQASLYEGDLDCFIAHHDRPYVVNLHKALYSKLIPLETIYKCGVFGLPEDTEPYVPDRWKNYRALADIVPGRAVILAPYAKSVVMFDSTFWQPLISYYLSQGYQCFTNVAEGEKPLEGTEGICLSIAEMKSAVERAGTFIGIRSGLCDVIRYAACRKIALYPDYYYSNTKWKAIDMYALEGWENVVVEGGSDGCPHF